MKLIIVTAMMIFGMYSLKAQIVLDELTLRDMSLTEQIERFKNHIPDSTYKWYWGVGYSDDESIQDAIHKAEMDNPPKEGEIQVKNYIIYNVTMWSFDENGKYIYYKKIGLKK